MPKPGPTTRITEGDRLRYVASWARMQELDPDLTYRNIAPRIGLKPSTISKILTGKQKQSTAKAELDKFFGGPPEDDKLIKKIIEVALHLDSTRRHMLHERAMALLEEQRRE